MIRIVALAGCLLLPAATWAQSVEGPPVASTAGRPELDPGDTSSAPEAASDDPSPTGGAFTRHDRARFHTQRLVSPTALLTPLFGATISQLRDRPDEWGRDVQGFGQRYGSRVARRGVEQAIQFGVGLGLSLDPRYHPSGSRSARKRLRHALIETFAARTSTGERRVAWHRLASAYGAAAVSTSWYPTDNRWRYTAQSGSLSLLFYLTANLMKELGSDDDRP